jgi:predicted DCC family thiol-disulfide oxidoreductase YuxK
MLSTAATDLGEELEPSPPPAALLKPLVLYDGECLLCNRLVQWLLARRPNEDLRFAPLQGQTAQRLRARQPRIPQQTESIVLWEPPGRISLRSTAALRICRYLPFPWRLLALLLAIPPPLRDWLYNQVALRRYRWFGKADHCLAPPTEVRHRFLP